MINVIIVIIENHRHQTSQNGIIVFWMIDPIEKHQITMKAELGITSNIDMNTRDLITGTYPSTTYM